MRIVVIGLRGFPDIQGGVETHCEQLFTRIAARGHEVIVLGRKPYMNPALTEYKGVRLIALPCPRRKSLEAFLHTLVGILEARRWNPDLVHVHAIGPSLLVPAARLLGLKVVSTNHGPDYDRAKWGRVARIMLRLGESMGSRFSNAVIAISEPIAGNLRDTYGCDPAVIPNGVVLRTEPVGQDALKRFGIDHGRYVLAVGRLVPEKGFHDLLDAFAMANLTGWKLVIAGKADHADSYSTNLQQKAAAMPDVVMAGFVTGEPLAQLYAHAGLFVLPSYHEGLPIALLEAMSYGLSVLASDIPANRQTGLPASRMFPPGNVARAAEQLEHFATRPITEEEKNLQLKLISGNHDWDRIAEQTIALYGSLLNPISVSA